METLIIKGRLVSSFTLVAPDVLIDANVLTEDEIDIYKRARNTKVNSHPSSTDIITYKMATGLEALFGYLYLNNKLERIKELINIIMEV